MRAARLDHRPELPALHLECALQALDGRDQLLLDRQRGRELDRGRDDIVRGLAQVDVIVWVHELRAALSTQDLGGAVGDDLVRVGVGRSAGPRLVDVDRELVVELAVDHLLRGSGDHAGPSPRQEAELAIGLRGRPLDHAQRADEAARKWLAGDREVEDGALRRGAVVRVGRDLHLTHGVALDPRSLGQRRDSRRVPKVG